MALLLTGCGTIESEEETSLESQEQSLAACENTTELAEAAEHSCTHAELGPFQNVTAAALGTIPFVDVSVPHTAYVVTLPAASCGGYGGSVIFTPEESTEYAFLTSRSRGLRIFDGNTEVTRECRYEVPQDVCGSLRAATIADLEAGKDYRLEFKAIRQTNAQFTLVIEETAHHDHEE
ncbi:hypothetical protein DAT35_28975 [Vitiosangium sp. GDMCC 1.1324]|nr:hypothetical protein DAT35_28975 [Vitiosangium sp. GDMCC 1.1324]